MSTMHDMPYIMPQDRWEEAGWKAAATPEPGTSLLDSLLALAQQCGCVRWIILPDQPDRLYLYWLNAKLHPEVKAYLGRPSALVEDGPMCVLLGMADLMNGDENQRLAAFHEAFKSLESIDKALYIFSHDPPVVQGRRMAYPFTGHTLNNLSGGGKRVFTYNDKTAQVAAAGVTPVTATDLANQAFDWVVNTATLELRRRNAWLKQNGRSTIILQHHHPSGMT